MPVELHIFDQVQERLHYKAGDVILSQGQESDKMYAVIVGEVDVIVDGKYLHTVSAGGAVGEMALIDEGRTSAEVRAKTDCELVPVDKERFNFLVQQTPYFALQMMKILVDRLREATQLGVKYL
ncbi:MAG: cyclic nucleotide-binding domain-containing protein [Anaerolineae bacterium]|nr:cyclic nucleotide-binding domain-containing protein [Anaerolineae bacterium]